MSSKVALDGDVVLDRAVCYPYPRAGAWMALAEFAACAKRVTSMMTGDSYRIEMLGGLVARQESLEIHRFRTRKTASLLAYLAFYGLPSYPRDVLIEAIWPDSPVDAARTNLSVALNALRQALEGQRVPRGSIVVSDRSQVHLRPGSFTTDVQEFQARLNEAEQETDVERRIAAQVAALEVYRGDLLPGLYCDWILRERDHLLHAYRSTLAQVISSAAERRQYERAIEFAHRMVSVDPLHEGACHALMRLYALTGRRAEALSQYEAFEKRMLKALQCAPSMPLKEFAGKLRKSSSSGPAAAAPVASSEPSEPAGPRVVFERVNTAEPPVRGIPPLFLRSFGRDREIHRLVDLIQTRPETASDHRRSHGRSHGRSHSPPPARLISLTGPGGIGKTRLAIESAWSLKEEGRFAIAFVELADLDDPARLGEALREALELPRPAGSTPLDQVIAAINREERPYLIVLDNFEQLAAGGAPVVWTLLNRAPSLRCLVTSRQALALAGEIEIPVVPLPVPVLDPQSPPGTDPDVRLLACPSVEMFVDRAQAARPAFQITPQNAGAIANICKELEGIPLAIELAAAHAGALTPAEILARLAPRLDLVASDSPDTSGRHRSLRAAFNWSFDLLHPSLGRFLARLSLFRGGWDLNAAEAVCDEPRALEYLGQLRGSSLVLADESSSTMRFRMLEALRQFAEEKLTADERTETEKRHTDYFHRFVTGARLRGSEQLVWFSRFEENLDNLRAVLARSLRGEPHSVQIGLDIAGALVAFWRVRGHLEEGRDWYARLLECAPRSPTPGRAKALYGAGALASLAGDATLAAALLVECTEAALAIGDLDCLATAHNERGTCAYRRGDFDQARQHYSEYLSLAREQGTPGRVASALTNLASVAQATGEYATSRSLNAESLSIWKEIGDRVGEGRTLHNLANLALSEGHAQDAHRLFKESLAIRRDLGDHFGMSLSLVGVAEAAMTSGDLKAAEGFAREGLAVARAHGIRTNMIDAFHVLADLAREAGRLEEATAMYATMERCRAEMGYPSPPAGLSKYQRIQADARAALGDAAYDRARAEGAKLSLEHAAERIESSALFSI